MFHAFVHRIQAQLGEITFEMPVAIAMTAMIPPIFGRQRQEAFDLLEHLPALRLAFLWKN